MSQCKPALLDLVPDTQEWLDFRKSGIGASDAPIIMRTSPWKTPVQLWEEKLSLKKNESFSTAAQSRGKRLEPFVLSHVEKVLEIELKPSVVRHANIDYLFSSLDGLSKDMKTACEIKCPNRIDHDMARAGFIPEKYKHQLMHQLETLQIDKLHYVSYASDFMGEDEFIFVPFYRDENEIMKMLKAEKAFWECMQDFSPPELTDKDYIIRNDSIWSDRAKDYLKVTETLKKLEDEQKKIKSDLISMAENKSTKGAGLSLAKIIRKGSVDYSLVPQLQEVDLEKYRKNPIETWRLSA